VAFELIEFPHACDKGKFSYLDIYVGVHQRADKNHHIKHQEVL
jgi:hypothetical protein